MQLPVSVSLSTPGRRILLALFICLMGCSQHFSNTEECRNFVRNASGNTEKLYVGVVACHWATMDSQTEEDKAKANASQCILDKFSSIKDDNSGTSVVTTCSESNKAVLFGRALAMRFSAQARLAKQMEEQQEQQNRLELDQQQQETRERFRAISEQSDRQQMMMKLEEAERARQSQIRTLEIDGTIRSCSQIGDRLSCD
jgi:hypothetical protein